MKKVFSVSHMTCSSCATHVEKAVSPLLQEGSVSVNLLGNSMTVEYPEDIQISDQDIIDAVQEAGYDAQRYMTNGREMSNSLSGFDPRDTLLSELKAMKRDLILSLVCSIPLMYIAMSHMLFLPIPQFLHASHAPVSFAFTQFLLTLPVLLVNAHHIKGGFRALIKKNPTMDSLIAIGSSAAMVYGIYAIYQIGFALQTHQHHVVEQYTMDLYFEVAAMILTLVLAGKYLEFRAKRRTSDALFHLMDLAPKHALVLKDGQEITIPVDQVHIGDIVVVKPGAYIPVDGSVLSGFSSVDESALTGESMPVDKKKGDRILSGSINTTGYLTCVAEKVGNDTTLSQIIELVHEASSSKAPISRLADQISRFFVPIVIMIAGITFVVWLLVGASLEEALRFSIAVLVISCPCALGLATPTAIMVGTGRGAQLGLLISSAESLEVAGKVTTVVLDKTGTITEGKPQITDIVPSIGISKEELLSYAASIESLSEHPLSKAIISYSQKTQGKLFTVDEFSIVPGKGLSGMIDRELIIGGNSSFMEDHAIDISSLKEEGDRLAQLGKTVMFFAKGSRFLGIIGVADVVKESSKTAIQEMMKAGLEVVMLTGDAHKTSEAIAKSVGIKEVHAQVLPQEKDAVVQELQERGKRVAMVGDGINDAPALIRSDVGIAIASGADIALESADIILMKSDLRDVVTTIMLSRATVRTIKQNLFWALFYNTLGIPLAAGVFFTILGWSLNPMLAAAAMGMSSIFVVTNALRLKHVNPVRPSVNIQGEQMNMNKVIYISGMSCAHCVANVKRILMEAGVTSISIDLQKGVAQGEFDSTQTQNIKEAIEKGGYTVTRIQEGAHES